MRYRSALLLVAAVLGVFGVLRAQRPFKQYDAAEYFDFPLPPDWNLKAEWTRARLRYPSVYRGFRGEDLNWTIDYPRSDRHLLEGVRRLTRIDTRSVEQVVDLDGSDDVYNWPMMYAVEVGHWAAPGRTGGPIARVSAARRIPDGGRFPRRPAVPQRLQ